MGREERDRSRDRKRTHKSSKTERRRKSRSRERSESYLRNFSRETSSKYESNVQKGIEAAKNRLKASLTTAIKDLKDAPITSTTQTSNYSTSLNVFDTLNQREAIDRIEEEGFQPTSFTSSNATSTTKNKQKLEGFDNSKQNLKQHDKAMFGPMWASKELEQKQLKQKQQEVDKSPPRKREDLNFDGLANEKLSANPELRQRKWMELYRLRRKLLMEGAL